MTFLRMKDYNFILEIDPFNPDRVVAVVEDTPEYREIMNEYDNVKELFRLYDGAGRELRKEMKLIKGQE